MIALLYILLVLNVWVGLGVAQTIVLDRDFDKGGVVGLALFVLLTPANIIWLATL